MNILKPHVLLAAALAAGMCCSARADEGLTDAHCDELLAAKWIEPLQSDLLELPNAVVSDFVAKAGPKQLRLMVASFGTIESMTQVDKWLGEQLQPQTNLEKPPTLSEGDKLARPDLESEVVRLNWNTRKMEYIRTTSRVEEENAANMRLLRQLRTKILTDAATRYVPLAKDYLQAALSRRAGKLLQVIDRSNADMGMVEQAINGKDASAVVGATCILTAALGDREEDAKTITVNAKGTKVKVTTFTQPYVGKVRDLQGNVLLAFKGTATWSSRVNNVVASEVSDPARKLVDAVCEKIADEVVAFFTTELNFKVKTPAGTDEDEVTVLVDGKNVDVEEPTRVLAVEHAVVATLDGCKPVKRIVVIDEATPSKTVKLVFKKKAAAAETAAE